jgi:hypothetical protein
VRKYEESSPRHQVLFQSRLNLPGAVELDAVYRHVSALPAQLVGSYSTGDLRMGWTISRNVSMAIAGQDLFAPRHAEFAREPGPGISIKRSAHATFTWQR